MAYPSQEVKRLRKGGKLKDARARAEELLKEHPEDPYLQGEFGWTIYDEVKACVQGLVNQDGQYGNVSTESLHRLLREYANLKLLERPSLLFSCLLGQLVRLDTAPSWLVSLLLWADPAVFRDEDMKPQTAPDGTTYASLAEKVALATGKALTSEEDSTDEQSRFGVNLIDLVLEGVREADIRNPEWLRYRKALLLSRLGEVVNARSLLLPIVRAKAMEWWVWEHWADLEEPEDSQLAHALLCQAAILVKDKAKAVKLYEKLARSFFVRDDFELAKWAAEKSLSIRQERQWSIPESLRTLVESDWYQQASEAHGVAAELARRAEPCKSRLYDDCPRREATYLGKFESKREQELALFTLRDATKAKKVVCPASRITIPPNLEVGTPVVLVVDESAEGVYVLAIEGRPEGQRFDCLPTMSASYLGAFTSKSKIEHAKFAVANRGRSCTRICSLRDVDFEKDTPIGTPVVLMTEDASAGSRIISVADRQDGESFDCLMDVAAVIVRKAASGVAASAYIDPNRTATLNYDEYPGIADSPAGSSVDLKCVLDRERLTPYECTAIPFRGSEFIRKHKGTYRARSEGFGFVDHVYVPRELAKMLADGCQVSVVAIMHPDMKKKTMGWKAIAVRSANEDEGC